MPRLQKIVYCDPVERALRYFHTQPQRPPTARALSLTPMKSPNPCGGPIRPLRNVIPVALPENDRDCLPEGWKPEMTVFAKTLLMKGEDVASTIIILETEYPQMVDKISGAWIHHLLECFKNPSLRWIRDQDLQNDHLGGDIITETVQRGCGRLLTGNSSCAKGWENPYGGMSFCPYIVALESGRPLPRRPEYVMAEVDAKGNSNGPDFNAWFHQELQFQARDSMMVYGPSHGAPELGNASFSSAAYLQTTLDGLPDSMPADMDRLVSGLRATAGKSTHRWPLTPVSDDQQVSTDDADIASKDSKGETSHDSATEKIVGGSKSTSTERGRKETRNVSATARAVSVAVMETCIRADCKCHGEEHKGIDV
ncbi:MAG: hypothetical protein Q9166_000916 [cf. Caloplaca sp. 2 TL-2023]